MAMYVIIDGNNLLHAMHAHAPIPYVARETMVKIIERWARTGTDNVSLVFDGPTPRGGLAQQMMSARITVTFSAPKSADDVIAMLIHHAPDPSRVRVVSSDTALRHEAKHRRCGHTDAVSFIDELFPRDDRPAPPSSQPDEGEVPDELASKGTKEWLKMFDIEEDDEPFDGFDEMMGR